MDVVNNHRAFHDRSIVQEEETTEPLVFRIIQNVILFGFSLGMRVLRWYWLLIDFFFLHPLVWVGEKGWRRVSHVFQPVTRIVVTVFDYINQNKYEWLQLAVLLVFFSSVIIFSTVFSYLLIYYLFVPGIQHTRDLHFDYSLPNPTAVTSIDPQFFYHGQYYNVFVELDIPQSPQNKEAGMFMVTMQLESYPTDDVHQSNVPAITQFNQYDERTYTTTTQPKNTTTRTTAVPPLPSTTGSYPYLFNASRPAILPYQSELLFSMSTLFYSLPLLLGWAEQKQLLHIQMADNTLFEVPLTGGTVTLSTNKIQLYTASISFQTQLSGWRYLAYHYFYSFSFLVISFLVISQIMMFLVWYIAQYIPPNQQDQEDMYAFYPPPYYPATTSSTTTSTTSILPSAPPPPMNIHRRYDDDDSDDEGGAIRFGDVKPHQREEQHRTNKVAEHEEEEEEETAEEMMYRDEYYDKLVDEDRAEFARTDRDRIFVEDEDEDNNNNNNNKLGVFQPSPTPTPKDKDKEPSHQPQHPTTTPTLTPTPYEEVLIVTNPRKIIVSEPDEDADDDDSKISSPSQQQQLRKRTAIPSTTSTNTSTTTSPTLIPE